MHLPSPGKPQYILALLVVAGPVFLQPKLQESIDQKFQEKDKNQLHYYSLEENQNELYSSLV